LKEAKAYVHRTRVSDVIAAMNDCPARGGTAGIRRHNLVVYIVKGPLLPLDRDEQRYSVESRRQGGQ